ncbi:UPF0348 protein YlbM [Shouchella clausii]|nr:UPF0348 protein YlbM [Shouchella clausii]
MRALGLVVEYNPFHNGHLHHLTQAKQQTGADVVVAVMSGTFLQRGEPALLSRWYRAEMALAAGADLVVELPYAYSVQTAERFAEGAVTILAALRCSVLNFGSEKGEMAPFYALTEFMNDHQAAYDHHVKQFLKNGVSYPKASAQAFSMLSGHEKVLGLDKPNNILGYHYVKAIQRLGISMEATTTLRIQAGYHDEQLAGPIASATAIRKALLSGENIETAVPAHTARLIQTYRRRYRLLHTWEHYFPFLQYKVLTTPLAELAKTAECSEGLEHRLRDSLFSASSFQDWLSAAKTKRYTQTRLQRLFAHLLTGTTAEENTAIQQNGPAYIRLLGMSETGKTYIREHKKTFSLPLVTRQAELRRYGQAGEQELRISQCYWLPLPPQALKQEITREFQQKPINWEKRS